MPLNESVGSFPDEPPDIDGMTEEEITAELSERGCQFPLDWKEHSLDAKRAFLVQWRSDDAWED